MSALASHDATELAWSAIRVAVPLALAVREARAEIRARTRAATIDRKFRSLSPFSYVLAAAGIAGIFWAETTFWIALALMLWAAGCVALWVGAAIADDFSKKEPPP